MFDSFDWNHTKKTIAIIEKKKKKSYWKPVFVVLWSVSCTPATDYISRAAEVFITFILIIRGKE